MSTGPAFLGLVLLSMAWLFFLLGAAINFRTWRAGRRARAGEAAPRGLPVLPGVVGSLAAFFTVPALVRLGVEVPWPWFWVLLPLALDAGGLGGWLLAWLGVARRAPRGEGGDDVH